MTDIITNVLLPLLTIAAGGGWFLTYKAYKRKANGDATQSEAEGWKAQQDVYQATIEDLKASCEYIKEDRNLLREENRKLAKENGEFREKFADFERQILELKKELARQEKILETALPFTCGIAGCQQRSRIEMKSSNENA